MCMSGRLLKATEIIPSLCAFESVLFYFFSQDFFLLFIFESFVFVFILFIDLLGYLFSFGSDFLPPLSWPAV